jgi:hypothetical protein
MRKTTLFAAAALALAVAVPAVSYADYNRLNVPRDQWLSASEISDKLASQGYKVLEIESDDGAYEVEMLDKNGVKIETHVHPATGELLPGYDD